MDHCLICLRRKHLGLFHDQASPLLYHPAPEYICFPGLQVSPHIGHIKPGHLQGAGQVPELHRHDLHMVQAQQVRAFDQYRFHRHYGLFLQLANGDRRFIGVISPWVVGKQIINGENAQLFK